MNFMTCNTCRCLVQVNCTGICLGCQMGFAGLQKDEWKTDPLVVDENNQGVEHATQEGKESKDNLTEYPHRDGERETSETSGSHCIKRGRKSKKEKAN